MELDKRIKEGKRPLTCFDVKEAIQFIGKECYFANSFSAYADLNSGTTKRILDDVSNTNTSIPYSGYPAGIYCYCLPCEWVKQPEKKYRPFEDHTEYKEYLNDGIIESWIQIREKKSKEIWDLMYTGGHGIFVSLGAYIFNLKDLFDDFELKNEQTGEWQPFGVIDE